MLSTSNLSLFPDKKSLKATCKAISVLDAVLSPEWEYRYYSYNSNWSEGEEFFEMRNGSGDHMLILFREEGCIINGFNHELLQQDKKKLTFGLPEVFNEFIYGEPVASIGTTFCLWTISEQKWQIGEIENYDDGSSEMLQIFDGKPATYLDWATEYFEGSYKVGGIPLETIFKIYNGDSLTKELVLSIVDFVDDWGELEKCLTEINYKYNFQ